jgi:hypothetical protein
VNRIPPPSNQRRLRKELHVQLHKLFLPGQRAKALAVHAVQVAQLMFRIDFFNED